MPSDNKPTIPAFKTAEQAVNEALEKVLRERDGVQRGLYCRWGNLNIGLLRYWRFNTINLIAAASGAGKSYMMNMLKKDFFNKALNGNFKEKVIFLHFNFEMSSADETLRTVGSELKLTYSDLLSGTFNPETGQYVSLSDKNLERVEMSLDDLKNLPIIYFENATSIKSFSDTVHFAMKKYSDAKFVVGLDHTLLLKRSGNERSDLDMIGNLAQELIVLKKTYNERLMVILLGQTNGNLEKDERISKNNLHYPRKTDIYAQAQLFWACDNVIVLNRPELLGIPQYGIRKLKTPKLVHLALIKSRFGNPGNVFLYENLANGTFDNINIEWVYPRKANVPIPLAENTLYELIHKSRN